MQHEFFFKVISSQKENLHLKKMLTQKTMIKFIPKWKIGKKWMMHDENKGMSCSLWLCAEHMRKIGH
jgi:glucuronate isomerase